MVQFFTSMPEKNLWGFYISDSEIIYISVESGKHWIYVKL